MCIMKETITIQIGQCGNQIGRNFWNLMLQEHKNTPDDDDALSSFFHFAPQPDGRTQAMKARALLVDMECGPLQETMRGPLGSLFDEAQFVMDVYGAGNNFAHGFGEYGPKYRPHFEEGLRRIIEKCESPQTFIVTHSLGGGTGSGVGSYMFGVLEDNYPELFRFSVCVFPSEKDDVVTSPYNGILSTGQLIDHADCVIPVDNDALQRFSELEISQRSKAQKQRMGDRAPQGLNPVQKKEPSDNGFDDMNIVVARMLCHLTASSRFHGDMNVDMNEICTNLVPYKHLHFLMTALSPYRSEGPVGGFVGGTSSSRRDSSLSQRGIIQRAFGDILSRSGQITAAEPCLSGSVTLASSFMTRGAVPLSDFLQSVSNAQKSLHFPHWNADACKIGMCATPSPHEKLSVLGVFNSTAFGSQVLTRELSKFNKFYKRKAMLHHYTQFIEADQVQLAADKVTQVTKDYESVASNAFQGFHCTDLSQNELKQGGNTLSSIDTSRLFPAF